MIGYGVKVSLLSLATYEQLFNNKVMMVKFNVRLTSYYGNDIRSFDCVSLRVCYEGRCVLKFSFHITLPEGNS